MRLRAFRLGTIGDHPGDVAASLSQLKPTGTTCGRPSGQNSVVSDGEVALAKELECWRGEVNAW